MVSLRPAWLQISEEKGIQDAKVATPVLVMDEPAKRHNGTTNGGWRRDMYRSFCFFMSLVLGVTVIDRTDARKDAHPW